MDKLSGVKTMLRMKLKTLTLKIIPLLLVILSFVRSSSGDIAEPVWTE